MRKSIPIYTRVTPETAEKIERMKASSGLSAATVVQFMLDDWAASNPGDIQIGFALVKTVEDLRE